MLLEWCTCTVELSEVVKLWLEDTGKIKTRLFKTECTLLKQISADECYQWKSLDNFSASNEYMS